MAETPQTPDVPKAVTSVWPGVFLLAVGIGMLAWAQDYATVAARFPSIVAATMIVLALLDILGRTALPGARFIQRVGGTGFGRREMTHNPSVRDQAELIGWVAGAFVGMAVLGILPASPMFSTLYVRLRGQRTWTAAITVGAVVLAFELVVFEWLLDYELYRGLFVARGGIAAW